MYSPILFYTIILPLFSLLLVWTLVWKAIAVWHAAGRKDKKWFIALFIFNTVGILDLIYLFRILRKPVFLWLIGVSLALLVGLVLITIFSVEPTVCCAIPNAHIPGH